MLFNVTYETVTPESAEDGDLADAGFYMEDVSLREAWDFLRFQGGFEADNSWTEKARWLTSQPEECFRTGESTTYSLHFPEKMTASSRVRVARLFKCYGVK